MPQYLCLFSLSKLYHQAWPAWLQGSLQRIWIFLLRFSIFITLSWKSESFLVTLSSSLSRDYYKHLSGPLLVFGVAWLSQAFCCSNIAAKISVNLCFWCDLMKMPPLSNNLCICWSMVLVFGSRRNVSNCRFQGSYCWPIVLRNTNWALEFFKVLLLCASL